MKRFILIIAMLVFVSLGVGCYGDDAMNYPEECEGERAARELRELREEREAEEQ